MKTTNPKDVDQILEFLNSANYQFASYLYKLPQMHNDIRTVISDAIKDPGVFASVNEQNQITMLILALKYEHNKYKVIGPFLAENIKPSIEDMNHLLKVWQRANLILQISISLSKKTNKTIYHS